MLRQLVKIKLMELISGFGMKFSGKKGKNKEGKGLSKGKIIGIVILYLYVMAVFGIMFGSVFYQFSEFNSAGFGWVYFAFYAIAGFVLMIMGSAAIAKSQIFDAKDNDLLLSMPIKPSDIILSRVMMLLVTNLAYFATLLIPAAGVWAIRVGFGVVGAIAFFVLSVALWLLSTAAGVLMGWVIAIVSRKAKNKTLVSLIFTLGFLAIYFYVYFGAEKYVEGLIANVAGIAENLKIVLPLYWFGAAISEGNVVYLILAAAIFVIPFIVTIYILSKTFNKLVSESKSTSRIKEKKASFESRSAGKALFSREASRLFSSAPYLLNSGISVILGVVAAVLLVTQKNKLDIMLTDGELGELVKLIPVFLIVVTTFILGMILFTSATISIEGNTLWILRSLPVASVDILRAKLKLHIIASLPAGLAMWLAINICFYVDPLFVVCSLAVIILFIILSANIGLIENLRHPFLNWSNEAAAAKSGIGVMLTMLLNMGLTFVSAGLLVGLSFFNTWLALPVCLLVYAALVFVTYRWIVTKGTERFEGL